MTRLPALVTTAALVLPAWAAAAPARAAPAPATVAVTADRQVFEQGRGTLQTLTAEVQVAAGADAWTLAPTLGQRIQRTGTTTVAGGTARWHRDWSSALGTTTEAFVAEPRGPFAAASLAQGLAVRLARGTTLTGSLRWSRYAGGAEVWFGSAEVRRYFAAGSAAYRLTRVSAPGRSAYLTHLVALALDDRPRRPRPGSIRGRSQLWLSIGQASLVPSQVAESFRGHDWSIQARRIQPLSDRLALTVSGGFAAYDQPGRSLHARSAGLGLVRAF